MICSLYCDALDAWRAIFCHDGGNVMQEKWKSLRGDVRPFKLYKCWMCLSHHHRLARPSTTRTAALRNAFLLVRLMRDTSEKASFKGYFAWHYIKCSSLTNPCNSCDRPQDWGVQLSIAAHYNLTTEVFIVINDKRYAVLERRLSTHAWERFAQNTMHWLRLFKGCTCGRHIKEQNVMDK